MYAEKECLTSERRFFVIEDDPDHQKIAEITLKSAGINDITCFGTGEEAIAYFMEAGPHASSGNEVILIDLMLPKISGFEILKKLKKDEKWQSSTMVVLSCSTSAEDREKSRRFGADGFLSKPLSLEHVTKLLSSIS